MARKRKPMEADEEEPAIVAGDARAMSLLEDEPSDGSSESIKSLLDVEFEWFDPQPAHDFHGLKTLVRQLFDVDNQIFDLSALTDLILSQPLLGSTVKVEGNESDPYAFLTVLNLKIHGNKPAIATIVKYLLERTATSPELEPLQGLLGSGSNASIGLLLTERLINLPVQVIPPMYKMLLEEIQWAIEEKEPYEFSHYLIMSKTYQEVVSALDAQMGGNKKKKQKVGSNLDASGFFFHPEDEVLQRHAICFGGFDYSMTVGEGSADSRRAFQENGIKPQGHLILIEAAKFEGAIAALEAFVGQI